MIKEPLQTCECEFTLGSIYEDCSYHPVLCTFVSVEDDELTGISLIDGSAPRSCSIQSCGPVPLTIAQATWIRANLDSYVSARIDGGAPDAIVPADSALAQQRARFGK